MPLVLELQAWNMGCIILYRERAAKQESDRFLRVTGTFVFIQFLKHKTLSPFVY